MKGALLMNNLLNVKITYNSKDLIENVKLNCPVCGHINDEFKGSSNGRTVCSNPYMFITTHSCECMNCESRWEVTTDEEDE